MDIEPLCNRSYWMQSLLFESAQRSAEINLLVEGAKRFDVGHRLWAGPLSLFTYSYYNLPKNARAYVEFIEKFVGVKVKYTGTGPAREDMIMRS